MEKKRPAAVFMAAGRCLLLCSGKGAALPQGRCEETKQAAAFGCGLRFIFTACTAAPACMPPDTGDVALGVI